MTRFFTVLASILLWPITLLGAPFLTGIPSPTEYQYLEWYLFSTLNHTNQGTTSVSGPVLELDWGAFPNLQPYIDLPWNSFVDSGTLTSGPGDITTGVVYRFLTEDSYRPEMSLIPAVTWPTGDEDRSLGNGHYWVQIPLAAGKTWGAWSTYANIGYTFNSAPVANNYPYGGWVLQRSFSEQLTLGAEIYSQGASSTTNAAYTLLNLGGTYDFSKNFSVLFSTGYSVAGGQHLQAYLGLYWRMPQPSHRDKNLT